MKILNIFTWIHSLSVGTASTVNNDSQLRSDSLGKHFGIDFLLSLFLLLDFKMDFLQFIGDCCEKEEI